MERTFLAGGAGSVAWLPVQGVGRAGPDGGVVVEKLLATAGPRGASLVASETALPSSSRGDAAAPAGGTARVAGTLDAPAVALAAAPIGAGVVLVVGEPGGATHRARVEAPSAAAAAALQPLGAFADAGPYCGSLYALDANRTTAEVAACGDKGVALLGSAAAGAAQAPRPLGPPAGSAAYTALRWRSVDTLVTVGADAGGTISVWDRRAPEAGLRFPGPCGAHAVDVLQSRPDACAVGGVDGTVRVWDLRNAGAGPATAVAVDGGRGAPVWAVRFFEPGGGASPLVVYATDAGCVGVMDAGGGSEPQQLHKEGASVTGVDVDTATGDVVACAQSECLAFGRLQ